MVCLDPELEEAPKGVWSCPHCVKQGITEISHRAEAGEEVTSTASEGPVHVSRKSGVAEDEIERDEHQEFCAACHDGGDLICCERCPASYHIGCLDPPLAKIPEEPWLCPRCGCEKPKGKVTKILLWRWREPQKLVPPTSTENDSATKREEGEETLPGSLDAPVEGGSSVVFQPQLPSMKSKRTREYFVKFADMSYWACEWVSELQLDVYHNLMLRLFFKKCDMDEPPLPEDGTSYR